MTTDELLIAFLIAHEASDTPPRRIKSCNFRGSEIDIVFEYGGIYIGRRTVSLIDYITWVFNYKGKTNEQE